jgi:hypothetical protein
MPTDFSNTSAASVVSCTILGRSWEGQAMTQTGEFECSIALSDPLLPVAEMAVLRAQYLFPDANIELLEGVICVRAQSSDELEKLTQQVRYTLYREHCAQRDAGLRQLIGEALFR